MAVCPLQAQVWHRSQETFVEWMMKEGKEERNEVWGGVGGSTTCPKSHDATLASQGLTPVLLIPKSRTLLTFWGLMPLGYSPTQGG